MKAKAGLLTLLIGMIGLVGFGETTADPVQNSTPDSISCLDTEIVLVSVEKPFQMQFEATYLEHQIDVPIFSNSLEDADYSIYDYRSLEDPGLIYCENSQTAKTNTTALILKRPGEIRQRFGNSFIKNKSGLKSQIVGLRSKFFYQIFRKNKE